MTHQYLLKTFHGPLQKPSDSPSIYLMYGPLESNITEQVNKSIMDVKVSITTALKDENKMLQVEVDILEKKNSRR